MMKIKTALISVSDKEYGLWKFSQSLVNLGIKIIATDGTHEYLKNNNVPSTPVSEITRTPEMLGGKVKTLHPKIHASIMANPYNPKDIEELNLYGIDPIELVVIGIPPKLARSIDDIDIGGPALIRSAAKNYEHVGVVIDSNDYDNTIKEIKENKELSLKTKKRLSAKAFAHLTKYNSCIANSLIDKGEIICLVGDQATDIIKGENPHQTAMGFKTHDARSNILDAVQYQGKPLSFNNIADANTANLLVKEFDKPTVAIIKHRNPCGVASHDEIDIAWELALRSDSESAFGGVVAINSELTIELAEKIIDKFVEVIIAPYGDTRAVDIIAKKPNIRLLFLDSRYLSNNSVDMISINGGVLMQSSNDVEITEKNIKCVTKKTPTDNEIKDMIFAMNVAKYASSNAIVCAKNEVTTGIGLGQTSRIGACRIAIQNKKVAGSVMASDGFIPFSDVIEEASKAGITSIIQPGGSIRDEEVIKIADEMGLAMVFTETRFFSH